MMFAFDLRGSLEIGRRSGMDEIRCFDNGLMVRVFIMLILLLVSWGVRIHIKTRENTGNFWRYPSFPTDVQKIGFYKIVFSSLLNDFWSY